MAKIFLPNECVLEDGRFLQLVLRPGESSLDEPVEVFDVNRAVNILRANPGLAASLLSQTRPGRTVYWTGERREATVGGRSFGVRLVNR